MTKKELRRIYKEWRFSLNEEKRLEYDEQIRNQVIAFLHHSKHVGIFLPIERLKEINLLPVLSHKEIHWYAPKTFFHNRSMEFVEIHDGEIFELTEHQIPEPKGNNFIDPKLLDAVIIPMLISDESGFRVGYGKGFYDVFLKRCSDNCKRIGVNYFSPVEKISDPELHDEPMHLVITPNQL